MGTNTEPTAVGELLRQYRKAAGMTQHDLAEAVGVSDGAVGQFETGRRNIGTSTLERIADALDLSEDERDGLRDARQRFAGKSDHPVPPEEDWISVSSLSQEDRAAVKQIVERLKQQP